MPRLPAPRWLAALLALPLFAVSAVWLAIEDNGGPTHSDLVLPGGLPATLYLTDERPWRQAFVDPPPADERPPVVIVVHGYAGDRAGMSGLARALARAGYAALAIDVRGHGANRNPFERGAADFLAGDLATAVDFARELPHVDGGRVALLGHSMGAGAALDFATRDTGVDAAVLVSGGWTLHGPYRPANALFLVAAGDPPRIHDRQATLLGRLAEVEAPEPGRTYGAFANGTAARQDVIEGTNHVTIVASEAAAKRTVAWLDQVFETPRETQPALADPRILPLALATLAFVLLLPAVGGTVARLAPRHREAPLASVPIRLIWLALAQLATWPVLSLGGAGTFLGLDIASILVPHYFYAGTALLLLGIVSGRLALQSLARDVARALPAAAIGMALVFLLMQPWGVAIHSTALTPGRVIVLPVIAALVLPYTLAFQLWLRTG
ncbi:MAG: alpha/beta fold hydrolase, partial [Proteobacteria bacterium]|nr:alpha/beta fold hydrolase [Pseudomonadota bacterium]